MVDDSMENTGPPTGKNSGSSVNHIYTQRKITLYAVSESEISTISDINTSVQVNSTIATFILSMALGIFTNAVFYDNLNVAGKIAYHFIAPIIAVIGLGFAFMAVRGARKRAAQWNEIRSSATEVTTARSKD